MSDPTARDQVSSMRASLQMLNLQLDRTGISLSGLTDLKAELDNMRLRVWAIMAAERANEGPESLERFRLRRAIEINSKVAEDLDGGRMSPHHPELTGLKDLAHRLHQAIQDAQAR
jgi:hypothetical protein